MASARASLKGRWGVAVGAAAVATLIKLNTTSPAVSLTDIIIPMLIAGPMALGLAFFFLKIARGEKVKISEMFIGFDRFGTALATYLLTLLFTLLWALLLIIPGIIAALSYSQVWFILNDHPGITAREAIHRSKKIMMGHKLKLFYLCLRFLGWAILCILTLGIGFLWLAPYFVTTVAKFYDDIKEKGEASK